MSVWVFLQTSCCDVDAGLMVLKIPTQGSILAGVVRSFNLNPPQVMEDHHMLQPHLAAVKVLVDRGWCHVEAAAGFVTCDSTLDQ